MFNIANILKYGYYAPRYGERLWVNPADIKLSIGQKKRIKHFGSKRVFNGSVIEGNWDQEGKCIYSKNVYKACYEHWVNGVKWQDTVMFNKMIKRIKAGEKVDQYDTIHSLKKRYERLDKIYDQVKQERRLRCSEEVEGSKRLFAKGLSDIEVFIDREGKPLHGRGGNHRLAIAKILELPLIPVKLGAIHPDGIKHLHRYRNYINE